MDDTGLSEGKERTVTKVEGGGNGPGEAAVRCVCTVLHSGDGAGSKRLKR